MEPQHELANEMRRLAELVITRPVGAERMSELAASLRAMNASLAETEPVPKQERFGGRNRVHEFLDTGAWPAPPPDGSQMDFDVASIVGGHLNPGGIGASYFRDGDEAVGRVTVGRVFEGPPGRVHGGVLCALFDEVMGSVFRATGTPSAFTGELAVRFVGPAPVEAELEFRARETRTDGRKRYLEATATGPDGLVATATSTFIDMKPEHLPTSVL